MKKIIIAILMIFVVFMGLKQGWAMVSANPDILEMFGIWNFNQNQILIFGMATLLSAILILFPKTFVWGNLLMAATILVIICFELMDGDTRSAFKELPFLLLNLLLIYLKYPFKL